MAVGEKPTNGSAADGDDHKMQLVGFANFKVRAPRRLGAGLASKQRGRGDAARDPLPQPVYSLQPVA